MFIMLFKSVCLLYIVNSASGHETRFKALKSFYISVNSKGEVVPLDIASLEKRSVKINLNDNGIKNSPDMSYINKTVRKRWFNMTAIDKSKLLLHNVVFKTTEPNDVQEERKPLENPISPKKTSNETDNCFFKFMSALEPILKKLDDSAKEESIEVFFPKNDSVSKFNKTNIFSVYPQNGESQYREDTSGSYNKDVQIKRMNNVVQHRNINNDDLYQSQKSEMPILMLPKIYAEKPKPFKYTSLWEQDKYTTPCLDSKPINISNEVLLQNLLMKTIDDHTNSDIFQNHGSNNEIAQKLIEIVQKLQHNNSSNLHGLRNRFTNKVVHKFPFITLGPDHQNVTNGVYIVKSTTGINDILNDLQSLNETFIYTKGGSAYAPLTYNTPLPLNDIPEPNPTFVRPECTRHKGQITCKMGKYTYVINNGNQNITNDALTRFVAMIYRRCLEGDKKFDISIVNPTTTPCVCLVTKRYRTTVHVKQCEFKPVTIVCTPVRKDNACKVEQGNNTQEPEEVIYECKWKRIELF